MIPTSRRDRIKIALVVAVVLGLVGAYESGWLAVFKNPEQLRQTLVDLGVLGYIAFIVAYATIQPFGVPGTVFVMAAPLVWPWPVAFALSMAGTMAASVVGFSFARFVARDWITPRIPARFRQYDDLIERRGFVAVALLRFVFWMPPLLHAAFGVSRVSFGAHFWGSMLGYIVPLLLMSIFGKRLFEMAQAAPLWLWVAVGATIVTTLGIVAARRHWRRARQP